MTRAMLAALAWLVVLAVSPAGAQPAAARIPPAPERWATDTAGFLSPSALRSSDRALEQFELSTGNQVLLWIGTTTGDVPIEDWAARAFEAWKVGRKGLDNGLVLFVFAEDRTLRIEVGYGLEGVVPDAVASRIINEVMVPKIQAGDRDGAILAGLDAIMVRIIGQATGPAGPAEAVGQRDTPRTSPESRELSCVEVVILAFLGLGFLVLLITNPQLALYLLFTILSSGKGGGGGGGFGGGGFSGGGGRSGGGGASGRW